MRRNAQRGSSLLLIRVNHRILSQRRACVIHNGSCFVVRLSADLLELKGFNLDVECHDHFETIPLANGDAEI